MRITVVFVRNGREIGETITTYNRRLSSREIKEITQEIAEERREMGYVFDYYKVYTEA